MAKAKKGACKAAKVQRFILPALTPDITIALGRSLFGSYFALDLQVAPGSPHTTVVSLGVVDVSPHSEGGIVIFDDSTLKTMGSRITPHLRPLGGFSAESAAAVTIGLATLAAVPISTTHVIGGAVSGVGATRGLHAVRWIWGKRIVYAWVLTFPGAAIFGAVSFWLIIYTVAPWIAK